MRSIARTGKQIAKKGLRFLPESIQLKIIKHYISSKLETIHQRELPEAITFFVTKRCNARCDHCFYWRELNTKDDELTLDEIDKIASSMKHGLESLALTGGEPTLRKDLGEICRIFNERCQTRNIGIASNGLLSECIYETCQWILKNCNLERLNIQISLDGLGETHDQIRKVPGAFSRAMETIKRLTELREKHGNFSINTAFAVQPSNYREIDSFIEYMLPLNVPLKFNIVRGSNYGTFGLSPDISSEFDPRSEDSASVSLNIAQLQELYHELNELNEKYQNNFWDELEQSKIHTTIGILKERRRVIPCYAGIIEGVIYSDGDVAICELTKPFANLREADYNFSNLWQSEEADLIRSKTRACACIHGCNLTTALRFEPGILYSISTGISLKNRDQRWKISCEDLYGDISNSK